MNFLELSTGITGRNKKYRDSMIKNYKLDDFLEIEKNNENEWVVKGTNKECFFLMRKLDNHLKEYTKLLTKYSFSWRSDENYLQERNKIIQDFLNS